MAKKSETFSELLAQIQAEKNVSDAYARKKHSRWKKQMKLLYNERKSERSVGDELMWSTTDTIIASLQEDSLIHEFYPTEAGDIEACELLNAMMAVDWNKMEMDEVQGVVASWAVYVGRCVVDCSEISQVTKTVKPRFVNPFLEFVDPYAVSMHGIGEARERSARWYGYTLTTTQSEVKRLFDEPTESNGESEGQRTLNAVRKLGFDNVKEGENASASILVWYTKYQGKCVRVLCDVYVNEIVQVLPVGEQFPLFDPCTGIGDEWYPRSAMDMIEDKHRTRAKIANTAKELIEEQLQPIALVKQGFPADLLENAESGDVIETDDPNGVRFVEKPRISNESMWLLESLQRQAEDALSVPEIQRGVQMDEQRTASELSILSSASRRRYGRMAKAFGRSFRKFWEIWYWSYQTYWGEETHQKALKVAGVYGPQWRYIQRKDITLKADVDIRIELKSVSDEKRIQRINQLMNFHQLAVTDPNYRAKEGVRMIAKEMEITTQEFNMLFPKSTDELEAEAENELLSKNTFVDGDKKVVFDIHQDHDAHIREHMKAEMTDAMKAHIEKHYEAKKLIRDKAPMLSNMGFMPSDAGAQMRASTQQQEISPLHNHTPLGLPTA